MIEKLSRLAITPLMLFAIVACCETEETVKLKGDVTYADFSGGVILIKVCESDSSNCDGMGTEIFHPGNCVKEITMDAPGPFEIKAEVSWAQNLKPDVQILAYLFEDGTIDGIDCDAGVMASVPVGNHSDIQLVLQPGLCPVRQ